MEEENMDDENNQSKRQNNENDDKIVVATESANAIATIAESSVNVSAAQIFKLNDDCFEHLFEWVSLTDLFRFRLTCKQMKQCVDYYIKLKYPRLPRISISDQKRLKKLCKIGPNHSDWFKHFCLQCVKLTKTMTIQISSILNHIETLRIDDLHIGNRNGDFYDIVLKHCPHLKCLMVSFKWYEPPIIGTSNRWLLQRYPMLEHFGIEIIAKDWSLPYQIFTTDLLMFLKQNSHIRILSTNSEFFFKIHHMIQQSNLKFNSLNIAVSPTKDHNLEYICDTLKKHNFYKKLNIQHYSTDVQHFSEVKQLNEFHNLELLSVFSFGSYFLKRSNDIPKKMAIDFAHLRRIRIRYAYLSDIRAFVCHSQNIREIEVERIRLNDTEFACCEDLDIEHFLTFDAERQNLIGACKVKIFINENLFLKLKWTHNAKIHALSLIELRRKKPYEANYLANYPFLR